MAEENTLTFGELKGLYALMKELEREREVYSVLKSGCTLQGIAYNKEPIRTGPGNPTQTKGIKLAESAERIAHIKDRLNNIFEAIDRIPDTAARLAIKYIYIDGYTWGTAAQMLKISKPTLYKRVKKYIIKASE